MFQVVAVDLVRDLYYFRYKASKIQHWISYTRTVLNAPEVFLVDVFTKSDA